MTDYKDKPDSELSLSEKIREAEKMAADGVPFEIICRALKISPNQIRHLKNFG